MLRLPEELRRDFSFPFGPVYRIISKPEAGAVCVGDYVSRLCLALTLENLILVVDGVTRREERVRPVDAEGFFRHRAKNPRGSLSPSAARLICELIEKGGKHIVAIEGEEDMLALPAIACMKPGWTVIYGIPERGACHVSYGIHATRLAQLRFLYLAPG